MARATPRKADLVARDLLQRIVAGDIEVGELLPKEDELAAHYDVNRGVVREAIKLLEVHRLVRPIRRRGTEVLNPLASLSPDVLRAMLCPRPGQVDIDVFVDLLEVRALIDREMTGLAAARRKPADVAGMRALLKDLEGAVGDYPAFDRIGGELTLRIARASGNRLYEMLAHWNRQVMQDLPHIFKAARPASLPHAQGFAGLVDLIECQDVETVQRVVEGFHHWIRPRLVAAARLANGEPLAAALNCSPQT